MANVYPASPALSTCDSLADEDLDALLAAQGQLSHWPTPPTADKTIDDRGDDAHDLASVDLAEDADDELWRIASAFTNIATGRPDSSYFDLELVLKALFHASVPAEVLALAYSILKAVVPFEEERADGSSFPLPDLAVTACLSLATTFTDDKAPGSDYWAREVSKGFWPACHIDMTILNFLTLPRLRILALSSPTAIDESLRELCQIANTPMDEFDVCDPRGCVENMQTCTIDDPGSLKVEISETAQWVNGALTPTETPMDTPMVETGSFLRLL